MFSSIIQASVSKKVYRVQFDVYKDEIHRTYKFSVEGGCSFLETVGKINGLCPNDYDFLTNDHKPAQWTDKIVRDGSYLLYFKEKDLESNENGPFEKLKNDDESISEPEDDCIQSTTKDDSFLDYSIDELMKAEEDKENIEISENDITIEANSTIEELPQDQPTEPIQQVSTSTIGNLNDVSTEQLISSSTITFEKKKVPVNNKPFLRFMISKLRKLNCFIK